MCTTTLLGSNSYKHLEGTRSRFGRPAGATPISCYPTRNRSSRIGAMERETRLELATSSLEG